MFVLFIYLHFLSLPGALLTLMMKLDSKLHIAEFQSRHPTIFSIPFQSDYKFMATIHDVPALDGNTQRIALIKGAPDRLIARCGSQSVETNAWKHEPIDRQAWDAKVHTWASKGYRVLALCRLALDNDQTEVKISGEFS